MYFNPMHLDKIHICKYDTFNDNRNQTEMVWFRNSINLFTHYFINSQAMLDNRNETFDNSIVVNNYIE